MARERPQTRAAMGKEGLGCRSAGPMRRRRVDVANVAAPEASSAWLGPETLNGGVSADGSPAVVWFVFGCWSCSCPETVSTLQGLKRGNSKNCQWNGVWSYGELHRLHPSHVRTSVSHLVWVGAGQDHNTWKTFVGVFAQLTSKFILCV